jgi:hypothetical protein
MIISIIRKRPSREGGWRRARAVAPMAIVGAIAAVALYATFIHAAPLVRL